MPHHHPSLAPTLPKPHYPLLCTITLASLVKGEVLSPEKIRATTGGIAPYPHQPFQNRTISISFRRGGARSSCCTKYCHSHNHCKRTTTPRSSPTLPKPHYPLLCTITLASLVKGEVLSPEKIRATTGGIVTSPTLPKPHYPLLCTITLASLVKGEVLSPEKIRATTGGIVTPPTLPKPHYPLLCTITLASLVKGRWIDGKQQTVALLRFACDMSTFLIYQTFCRQDGGIACYKLFQPCRHLR